MSNLSFNLYTPKFTDQTLINNITTAVYNIGTIRGKGSSTRIYNNCMNGTDDDTQECLNLIIGADTVPSKELPVDNLLFNTSTFNMKFYIDGKFQQIPEYVRIPLLLAADRWSKLLALSPDMVKLMRTYLSKKNWQGLELLGISFSPTGDKPTTIASCSPSIIRYGTTLISGFNLNIYTTNFTVEKFPEVSQRANILAHELGHGLGFVSSLISLVDGSGTQLLPNIQQNALKDKIDTNPKVYTKTYYPNTINSYNAYVGYKPPDLLPPPPPNIYIPLGEQDAHWKDVTLLGLELNNPPPAPPEYHTTTNFFYRGFYNEIMVPTYSTTRQYYISGITKGTLLTLYTQLNGKKYYNYISVKEGSEITKYYYEKDTELIVMNYEEPKMQLRSFINTAASNDINAAASNDINAVSDIVADEIIYECVCCPIIYLDTIPENQLCKFIAKTKRKKSLYYF
jgi:hypothetical protein